MVDEFLSNMILNIITDLALPGRMMGQKWKVAAHRP